MDLDIYLVGTLVACTASRSRGRKLAIEYVADIGARYAPETSLLSCSLPTPGPSAPYAAQAFLEGLLPEGDALRSMAAKTLGARLDPAGEAPALPADTVNLLAEFGRECAGAISLLPIGTPVDGPLARYEPLTDAQIAELIEGLPQNPLGSDLSRNVRMSLAGAQPKLLMAHIDGDWAEPIAGAHSTHIVKPETTWALSADNEAIVMNVARMVGLTDAATWVEDFGTHRVFVAERFDRHLDRTTGTVQLLHQEDMCQALAMRPMDKYRIGRPSKSMATLLRRHSTDPSTDVRELLRQVTFRALVGDEDSHGKNFGLLLEDGNVQLAPIYDCLTTVLYGELSGTMAAPVGRQSNLAKVDLQALIDEGSACGLPSRTARELVTDLAEQVRDSVDRVDLPKVGQQAIASVGTTIRTRAQRLLDGQPMGAPTGRLMLSTGSARAPGNLDHASRGR